MERKQTTVRELRRTNRSTVLAKALPGRAAEPVQAAPIGVPHASGIDPHPVGITPTRRAKHRLTSTFRPRWCGVCSGRAL